MRRKHRATGRGLGWRKRIRRPGMVEHAWIHWFEICGEARHEYERQLRFGADKREAMEEALRLTRLRVPWAKGQSISEIVRRCFQR